MPERSPARQGLDHLLAHVDADLLTVDLQPPRTQMAVAVDEHGHATGYETMTPGPPGPWWCVDFADGQRFAIWKETGVVYRVGQDGAVEDDTVKFDRADAQGNYPADHPDGLDAKPDRSGLGPDYD